MKTENRSIIPRKLHSRTPLSKTLQGLGVMCDAMRAFHRYEVVGLHWFPKKGRALVACTHSFATYDTILLASAVYDETGRVPWSLVDRLFFKVPGLRDFMPKIRSVEGAYEKARELLLRDELLWCLPGGMREALRPTERNYEVLWEDRRGFVRLALATQTPILLAACPAADDIYIRYPNPITDLAYRNLKVPFHLVRGLGFTPIPRPVKLTHYVSRPITPPPIKGAEPTEEEVAKFHQNLMRRMRVWMRLSLKKEQFLQYPR